MDKIQLDSNELYSPDGVVIIDKNKKIITFNEAARRITGYKKNEITLKDFNFLFKDSDSDKQHIEKALSEGKSFSNVTVRLHCSDDRKLNVFASITPIKRSNNKIISVVFIFRDANEMVKLSESLQNKIQEMVDEKNSFKIFSTVCQRVFSQ